jgi:hypothetical protein
LFDHPALAAATAGGGKSHRAISAPAMAEHIICQIMLGQKILGLETFPPLLFSREGRPDWLRQDGPTEFIGYIVDTLNVSRDHIWISETLNMPIEHIWISETLLLGLKAPDTLRRWREAMTPPVGVHHDSYNVTIKRGNTCAYTLTRTMARGNDHSARCSS